MTAIIASRADKTRSINLLEEIISRFVLTGIKPDQAFAVGQHMAWLHKHPNDLYVNCKLETVPELQLTRVVLEYSFLPIPGLKSN